VSAADFVTNEEVILAARRFLAQGEWDYLAGASESETTMRRNRLAFDRLAFRPRVLVDVSKIDTSSTFMGHKLRIPVMLAPIGSMQVFRPEGAALSSMAAEEFGTIHVLSSVTEPSLEETQQIAKCPKILQLYVRGDMDWVKGMVDRVKAAGYIAMVLTVDTAVPSRRERVMVDRWNPPTRQGRAPGPNHQSMLTWEKAAQVKEWLGDLPVGIKGVGTAEDAELAIQHGMDIVWVSNHGGRQLDHGLGAMDTLPEIVQAVGGRAQIILDGGVQRGADVLKALALGAHAVAIGKMQGFGFAAAGKEGVVRVLEIMQDEMSSAMGLLGVTSLDQLNPRYLCNAEPVTDPHEMSGWVNIPGVRVR
jgi:glycolate oxidase